MSEIFRDHVSTIDDQGRRVWIYPKKPKGALHRARALVALFLLAIFFITPFIKVYGRPIMLFDILNRRFIIFGLGFWPQDFYLFVLATLALIVFIVLFTVVFGRLWCGWACPQTIFMEMVFRKIEYWIEGDAKQQRALNAAPMSGGKFIRKSLKHIIFYSLSFIISHAILSYFIGVDILLRIMTDPPYQHLVGLTIMLLFSGVFYFVFAFFREQACTMVCPYGRLQGVLLDPHSIIVAYDFKRGEPRGKISRKVNGDRKGDCVDCHFCVNVCPTGIDIRNGTQLECINCTACIDACNFVMVKVKRRAGLIRYASFAGISAGRKLHFTPRILGYSAVLSVLIIALIILFAKRSPVDITILRTPGLMYQQMNDGAIANLYNLSVINKTFDPQSIHIKLLSPQGEIMLVGGALTVAEGEMGERSFFIKLPKEQINMANMPVRIQVSSGQDVLNEWRTSFIAPVSLKK